MPSFRRPLTLASVTEVKLSLYSLHNFHVVLENMNIINIRLETVVCLRICAKAVDRICESNQNAADSFCEDLFDFDPTALN